MDKSSRIATAAAVVVSCVSLGLSAWVVASRPSQNKTGENASEPRAYVETPSAQAPQTPAPAAASISAPAPASTTTAQASLSRGQEVAKDAAQGSARLQVKRLVVARGIENHEPIEISDAFKLEAKPIYAFVELENGSGNDSEIVVSFEKGSKRTGMVELAVPSNAKRWRTWGKSNRVNKAGQWYAVVKNSEGKELARTPFSIES